MNIPNSLYAAKKKKNPKRHEAVYLDQKPRKVEKANKRKRNLVR